MAYLLLTLILTGLAYACWRLTRMGGASPKARTIGPDDEPLQPGTIVAVNYGDYRTQEIWVKSGTNIGNWYLLDNEHECLRMHRPPKLPQHPHWEDILKRGPVTLLVPAADEAYLHGWMIGRRRLWEDIEELAEQFPKDAEEDR